MQIVVSERGTEVVGDGKYATIKPALLLNELYMLFLEKVLAREPADQIV